MDYISNSKDKILTYFKTHKIPNYFYLCFFGELIKMFGANILIPDKGYLAEYDDDGNIISNNEEDYSYKDQLDYCFTMLGGTSGWNLALKEACIQCGLMDFYLDYSKFDWVESDLCDAYITEEMWNIIFSNDVTNSYYKFILVKVNNYDY